MPLKDSVPLLKFFGSFIAPILYIVGFANRMWIVSQDREWGLWSWCYTNFTDEDETVNMTRCHGINPGSSPGYYEAVRTFACFTLVAFILFFWTLNPKEGMGREYTPAKIAAVACAGTVIVVGTLGARYQEDERWREEGPSPGWAFWLVCGTAFLSFLMVLVFAKSHRMQSEATPSVSPSTAPRRPASTPPPSSQDRGRKATVFHTATPDGAGSSRSTRSSEQPPATSRSGGGGGGDGGGRQLPVLSLPRYDIPSEPGSGIPLVPPPSYEEVVAGGTLSPPPPYTVTEASHHRSG